MKLVAVTFVLALAACHSNGWVDVPHPSPERIKELMALPVPEKPKRASSTRLEVSVDRSFVMAGGSVRVTCFVPPNLRRAIRFGVANVQASERPLASAEESMVVRGIPCGRWVAFCQLATGELATRDVVGLGGMCDG